MDFFLLVFPRKMAQKNPSKNPPRKPNTKIHESFQARGVLEDTADFLAGSTSPWVSPTASRYAEGAGLETLQKGA